MSLKKRLGWRDLQCYEQFLNYSREAPVSFRRSGGMHVVMHLQPGSAQSEHSCAVHKFNQHGLSMLRGGCNTVSWKTEKRWFDGFPHCPGYHEEDLWQPGPAISNLGLGCHKDVFSFHFIRHLITFALLIWLHHILSWVQGERYWRQQTNLPKMFTSLGQQWLTVAVRSDELELPKRRATVRASRIRVQSHMEMDEGMMKEWTWRHGSISTCDTWFQDVLCISLKTSLIT